MKIGAFILGLIGPVMSRILAALGMSLVTMTGLAVAVDNLRGALLDGVNGMPMEALMILGLFGAWHALAIVLAAITFVVAWQTTKGFTAVVKS